MLPAQIGAYAYNAGVKSQGDLQAAIAIALAESSGNQNATGDVGLQNGTWGPSLGLWQIRSLKAESGKGTTRDATRLKDPAFNAKSMFSISNGGHNWSPWSTWPLRAAAFMPIAIPTATSVIAAKGLIDGVNTVVDGASDAVSGAVDAVTPDGLADIGTGVRSTYNWVSDRNNWLRVAKVVVGGGMLLGGTFLMAKPLLENAAAGEIGKIAGKALKG